MDANADLSKMEIADLQTLQNRVNEELSARYRNGLAEYRLRDKVVYTDGKGKKSHGRVTGINAKSLSVTLDDGRHYRVQDMSQIAKAPKEMVEA